MRDFQPDCTVIDREFNKELRGKLGALFSGLFRIDVCFRADDVAYRYGKLYHTFYHVPVSVSSIIPDTNVETIRHGYWDETLNQWVVEYLPVSQFQWATTETR